MTIIHISVNIRVNKKSSQPDPCFLLVVAAVARLSAG